MAEKPANDNLRQHVDELAWMREVKHEREIASRHEARDRDMWTDAERAVPQPFYRPFEKYTPEQEAETEEVMTGIIAQHLAEQQSSDTQGEDLFDQVKRQQEARSNDLNLSEMERARAHRAARDAASTRRQNDRTEDDPRW